VQWFNLITEEADTVKRTLTVFGNNTISQNYADPHKILLGLPKFVMILKADVLSQHTIFKCHLVVIFILTSIWYLKK